MFFDLAYLIIVISLATDVTGAATSCAKDACFRAVSSNRFNPTRSARHSGCKSFLRSTVTPAIITETITPVGTVTPPHNSNVCPTTSAAPSKVPRYAAPVCANTVIYSSACACFRIKAKTTTIRPCTTTIVAEVTSRSTTTTTSSSSSSSSTSSTTSRAPVTTSASSTSTSSSTSTGISLISSLTSTIPPTSTSSISFTSTISSTSISSATSTSSTLSSLYTSISSTIASSSTAIASVSIISTSDVITSTSSSTFLPTTTSADPTSSTSIPTTSTTLTSIISIPITSTSITSTTPPIPISLITSSTTTSTSSSTITIFPAPTVCGNQGLVWAYFNNPDPYDGTNGWPQYDPSFTDGANPSFVSTVNDLEIFSYSAGDTLATFYQQYIAFTKYFVLNHQGYIWAPQDGIYTFEVSNVDDNFNLWLGANAYNGWDRANSNMDVFVSAGVLGSAQYSVELAGGNYYPFRYTLAQADGAANLNLTVVAPDGSNMFPPGSISNNLVQNACFSGDSDAYAPEYVPFGYNYQKKSERCAAQNGCLDAYDNCIAPGCYGNSGCVPLGFEGCNTPIGFS